MITLNATSLAPVLAERKRDLASILSLFDREARIYYVDYPVHRNVGDLLINLGTEQFISDHGLTIAGRFSVLDITQIPREHFSGNTVILCHGGGNFGDLYPKHQKLREWVLESFSNARIVFLPQSLHFVSPVAEIEALTKIRRHSNCHVLVRDSESLESLRRAGIESCSMMPDMAHQLCGVLQPSTNADPDSEMFFIRRDKEATGIPLPLARIAAPERCVDWRDLSSKMSTASVFATYVALRSMAHLLPADRNARTWYAARDRLIGDAVAEFSRCARVYTNRLHAMILALLMGREVLPFDNSYGKLSRYIRAFLTEVAAQGNEA